MKIKHLKNILNIMLVFILIIFSNFGLVACMDTGGEGIGGGGSGGSGGSDDGDSPIEVTSESEDDFFSGVLLMYDAGYNGEFYDKSTESNKTFMELLDRQITTFTTHLLYGLNVLYGDNEKVLSGTNDSFDLLFAYSELSSMWGNIGNLSIKPATILSDIISSSSDCAINTSNFGEEKDVIASGISAIAGLGEDSLGNLNQFNFNNAIKGGYLYEVTNAEESKGEFTSDFNTANKWELDVTDSAYDESIRNAIANILSAGTYDNSIAQEDYETALQNIEYLGFSKNDLENIAEYVLNRVIGSAYSNDENIRNTLPSGRIDVVGSEEGEDKFPTNTNAHYYKGYRFAVNILVERMANITTTGLYATSNNFESEELENRLMTYMIMPRTTIEIKRCSDLFPAKVSEDNYNSETGDFDINVGDSYDQETGEFEFDYDPILENVKLKQIVFIPKLSEKAKNDYREKLEQEYGANYTNYLDYRFDILSLNMSLNATVDSEEARFRVLPTFTVMADGECVHQDKVKNDVYEYAPQPVDAFPDEYSYMIDYIYDAQSDEASFNIDSVMSGHKFSDYNGVQVFDNNNNPSENFFHDNNFIVNFGASLVAGDETFYYVDYSEDGDFLFTFNGGENFFQIDFSYFSETSTNIYDENGAVKILPQIMDLVTLSIWT